ncbi:MAG: fumarylacetoacetate hydrolase family protein [Alphaproteobacteria bacterium]
MTTKLDPSVIEKAAGILRHAQDTATCCPPIRDLISAGGVDGAYAVQNANTEYWLSKGRRLVGRKAGLTSISVQKQLGVDQPDYGMLFADMDVPEGQPISLCKVLQPKVEAEIAMIIGRDLDRRDITIAEMIRAIEYVVPAIEVVASRIANWDIRIWDTIADNASAGVFVLGAEPRKIENVDLRYCGMVMECQGEQLSVGAGVACLGNPVSSALWLAQVMAREGRPFREGDVILTGALGPMAAVKAGDVMEARINGLGSVRAIFEAGDYS